MAQRGTSSLLQILSLLLLKERGTKGVRLIKIPIVNGAVKRYTMPEIASNHPQTVEKLGETNLTEG